MSLRISHWVWVVLLLSASAFLYHTSYQVQALEHQIAKLEATRAAERENIHVLQAEWASLTAPARLQHLADKFLQLQPVATVQIVAERRLTRVLPRRESAEFVASTTQPQLALASPRGMDAH